MLSAFFLIYFRQANRKVKSRIFSKFRNLEIFFVTHLRQGRKGVRKPGRKWSFFCLPLSRMPTRKTWLPLAVFLLFLLALPGHAQKRWLAPVYMYYMVQDGDTVFLDTIQPAWVFPKASRVNKTHCRKNCRHCYNIKKVYPYALLGTKLT